MKTVNVYQIGLGSFGRHGFEKFVSLTKDHKEVDVRLKAVCDTDHEKLEAAEKFASTHGIEIDTFTDVDEMYEAIQKSDEVLVYDAGPSETHANHIYKSMRREYYHIAEKPPSLTKEGYIQEKKLAENHKVFWKTDFIERESPVVKKTANIVEDKNIESIQVFRESSAGVQKMLDPVARSGVKGGDILDKMVHEAYLNDFLEASSNDNRLEFQEKDVNYFIPYRKNSDSLMTVQGGKTDELTNNTATGQTRALMKSGSVDIELHSSWMGLSDRCRTLAHAFEGEVGEEIVESETRSINNSAYQDEEARFFILEGEENLLGDMLHNKLYDLNSGEEVKTPVLLHDQLYRVLEKAVEDAAGVRDAKIYTGENFLNQIFKARDDLEGEFFEEVEKGRNLLDSLIIDDKVLDVNSETEDVRG
ncbi:MAG: hypothetical protein ACI977_000509 [Candidatus Nanohaloarchaea archaeon]